jgi:hypothetical protein
VGVMALGTGHFTTTQRVSPGAEGLRTGARMS